METKRVISSLITTLSDKVFQDKLIRAYFEDTAYLIDNIRKREVEAPCQMLSLYKHNSNTPYEISNELEAGKVAVLLPKNGLNIVIAKAVMASYLSGNYSVVKIPRQLKKSYEVYKSMLESHIPNLEVSSKDQSSKEFLVDCMLDPEIHSVVIYGDDKWISEYWEIAKSTRTRVFFEGPGKDPQLIFPGANLEKAVRDAVICGLVNGGQSCSAFERFYIHSSLSKEFHQRLVEELEQLQIGRPDNRFTQIGPIASNQVKQRALEQINDAIYEGAKLLSGGQLVDTGYQQMKAIQPTVLSNCLPTMRVVFEETFAPVFPIIEFEDTHELLHDLDKTNYGLNASAYGEVPEELKRYLETNHRKVFYNSTVVCSENEEYRLVDGGCKNSGFIWGWNENTNEYEINYGSRLLIDELRQGTYSSQLD